MRLNPMEAVGALMVISLALVAVFAPMIAPHDPVRAVANTFWRSRRTLKRIPAGYGPART